MATKFIIDHEDAIQAIRKQYGIPSTVEIVVNWKETPVSGDVDWIDVPEEWNTQIPPYAAASHQIVDVMFRNGSIRKNRPGLFSWCQQNHAYDIIKWRPAK